MSDIYWPGKLYEAAERRSLAVQELRDSLESLNWTIRRARAAGMSAVQIADQVGVSRQRVYEILREEHGGDTVA